VAASPPFFASITCTFRAWYLARSDLTVASFAFSSSEVRSGSICLISSVEVVTLSAMVLANTVLRVVSVLRAISEVRAMAE
jgi:hypothetical protein